MQKMRALIVDDEPLAREGIRQLLLRETDIETCGECSDGLEAIEEIERKKPDLLFLDVQMPEIDGFEVLDSLQLDRLPGVIFVTAYDQYALRAFDVHAVDYLLKPLDVERFHEALDRARQRHAQENREEITESLRALLKEARVRRKFVERFVARSVGKIQVVRAADIDWIDAEADYACLHCRGKKHLIRQTMNILERRLDPDRFMRIHRSTIVNIDRVKELQTLSHGDCTLLLEDGTRLTMSRTYRERFDRIFNKPS
jgi:two-component system LytT family response regulator